MYIRLLGSELRGAVTVVAGHLSLLGHVLEKAYEGTDKLLLECCIVCGHVVRKRELEPAELRGVNHVLELRLDTGERLRDLRKVYAEITVCHNQRIAYGKVDILALDVALEGEAYAAGVLLGVGLKVDTAVETAGFLDIEIDVHLNFAGGSVTHLFEHIEHIALLDRSLGIFLLLFILVTATCQHADCHAKNKNQCQNSLHCVFLPEI